MDSITKNISNGLYRITFIENRLRKTKLVYIVLFIILTILTIGSFIYNYQLDWNNSVDFAKVEARAGYEKDVLYRKWSTMHGGTYVPVTEQTPPNEYLNVPEREIITPSGKKLTLVNPAYMTRQVYELSHSNRNISSRIISLNPLNPKNSPDEWERIGLEKFEKGVNEVSELSEIDGEPYLRVLSPFLVEDGCLKCHGHQGYKKGDVRGGITISIPFTKYVNVFEQHTKSSALLHGLFLTTGYLVLIYSFFRIRNSFKNEISVYKENKELEEKLFRSQKMEAIGILAGGVAHDLNNTLSSIVSYPEIILLKMKEDDPLREKIEVMKKSALGAAEIVQDLLTLARRGISTKEIININSLIDDFQFSPEFQNIKELNPSTKFEFELLYSVKNIIGSTSHLKKSIINLVYNAAESIDGEGLVIVKTRNESLSSERKAYTNIPKGEYSVIEISDNGSGISESELSHIFEPFYTKKKMGRSGSGLGMTVVWGTLQDHNGYVDIKSSETSGTKIILYFPVTNEKLKDKTYFDLNYFKGNKEKILIIDDNTTQREVSEAILKELNYSPISVSSGEEALKYLKNNDVDVLLLDMIMDDGINGFETYEEIIKIKPKQKAIIVSGFSESNDVKNTLELGANAYIKKPFKMEDIGQKLKSVLSKE